jgi:hypothetical protein
MFSRNAVDNTRHPTGDTGCQFALSSVMLNLITRARRWWLIPVVLVIWEAVFRTIVV